jgi:hypothetical protein
MKHLISIASVAALAIAAPAYGKPGKGHGKHGNPHVTGHYVAPGLGACPPGLAKKGCMPPGQMKNRFNVGQRFDGRYGSLWNYNQIPYDLRRQYDLERRYRYYYDGGHLYQVDPRTMLIQQVVSALLR